MSKRLFLIAGLFVYVMASSGPAFGYGGGNEGGGSSEWAEASFGGGAVSWAPNPNGADVIGSSIWRGRPESLEKGPYQPDKAVEDAEQDLLDGFKSGQYTSEEVKENLQWAQRVGIAISDEAKKTLENILNPPPPPKPADASPASAVKPPAQSTASDKAADYIEIALNILSDYYQLKENNRAAGVQTTKAHLDWIIISNIFKVQFFN